MSIAAVAISAIASQATRFGHSAERVARASQTEQPDLVREAGARTQAETAIKANAAVIKTAVACTKSLLDILA